MAFLPLWVTGQAGSLPLSDFLRWSVGPLCKMQKGGPRKRKQRQPVTPSCPRRLPLLLLQLLIPNSALWPVHVEGYRDRPDRRFHLSAL